MAERRLTHILQLVLSFTLLSVSTKVSAFDLLAGGGASYTSMSQGDTTGQAKAWYSGLGLNAELRANLNSTPPPNPKLGLEPFITISSATLKNAESSITESNQRLSYGGGLDFAFSQYFIGAQFEKTIHGITAGSTKSDLQYGELGLRAGLRLPINRNFYLTLGGIFAIGSTDIQSTRNTTIKSTGNEFRAFLNLNIFLFGSGSKSGKRG